VPVRKSYYPELQNKIDELNREKDFINDIINSMPSSIIGIDREGIINRWNRNAENTYGFSSSEAEGRPLSDILPYLSEEIKNIKESQIERIQKVVDGTQIYESLTLFPLTGTDSEGAVLRIDNVTEQVRLQETMVQSEKILSIGGLAAGMAHELNNPLAGIMQTAGVMSKRLTDMELPANLKAAEKAGLDPDGLISYIRDRGILKMLSAINESGKRASAIIRNMLRFSRQADDSYSSVDPMEMIDLIIQLASTDFNLQKQFDFKNIIIKKEYREPVPHISCSESQIQQVILNLLKNGAEATSDIKEPRIRRGLWL